ncbi:gluconate:proton symporter [Enterococcus sp. BWM-S5]|uniref:Gluconate:proton symporter n=1 Tax=Enterococcus larvae TaxID=2794352 RepID=A0ABS4CJC8_9ENTE|nr:gluconate:proton symporter [Enterococcus larvae]MBP1046042.1 gluconate:proton symporter [Enterococcus larvae]
MDFIIGVILLITYFLLIRFAAKGGNLMVGFFVMAIIWVFFSIIGGQLTWDQAMVDVFQGGPESWGATAVIVIFGSWFGRILIETEIASSLIKKTVELSGENPLFTTILLCVVTTLIFTSTFGAGAVVAIGIIVLPILMSLGVPKPLAVTSYLMSVGSGMYVNIVLFKQMQGIFTEYQYDWNYLRFGFTALGVQLLMVILMLVFGLRKKRTYNWAAAAADIEEPKDVPIFALITPVIPVVLAIFFGWQPIPAFIVASLYALAVCGKLPNYKDGTRLITRTFYEGVVDVASLLGFLFILPMFNKASGIAAPFFQAVIGDFIPTSTLVLAIVFAILIPFGLFRGPLTIFGAGSATVGILMGMGVFPVALLFPLMYIPTISMNLSTCPTQSWNLWALNYSKVGAKEFMMTGVPWGWLAGAINVMICYFMFG